VAVQADDAALTYHELSDAASALAGRLRELGVGPGDRVGVRVSSGTTELYVAILGALTAGAAYVPVDADDPPARAAEIWQLADACAVIEDDLIITELATGGGRTGAPTVDDDAWVIFTSGSTGRPKGVAVTHRAAAALVDAEARLWSLGPEDRVLAGLSVAFDASCEEMWLAWRHGAALVPAPRAIVRSGAELGPWLADHRITVVSTVPTLAALWDEAFLADVRLLILGGEACPKGLAWRLAKGRELWNTYGPTEAAVVSTAARIRPGDPVTIGWPLDGWQIA
jgi:non-ribosomal peptide synthetase component F